MLLQLFLWRVLMVSKNLFELKVSKLYIRIWSYHAMFISVYFRCCCHRRWKEMPGLDNKPQLSAMGLTTGSVSPWRIRRDWRACCAHINLYGLLCPYTVRTCHDFAPHVFFTINHHLRPISWLIFKREFPQHSWGKSQSLVVIAGWGSTATDTHTTSCWHMPNVVTAWI